MRFLSSSLVKVYRSDEAWVSLTMACDDGLIIEALISGADVVVDDDSWRGKG